MVALATAFAPPSWGLAFDEPPEAPEPTVPYPYPVIAYDSRTATVFNNRGFTITIPAAVTTAGAPVDMRQAYTEDTVVAGAPSIFGGGRDLGDFLCTACPMTGGVENASEWGPFIYSVVNPILWRALGTSGLNNGAWRPGDTVALCDGVSGVCIILEWRAGGGTNGWWPSANPKVPKLKVDRRKYKNKPENQSGNETGPNWVATPLPPETFGAGTVLIVVYLDRDLRVGRVDVVQPPPPPPPSGGGGGGSCVHVDSRLPDGRRAGDIKAGDTIQLGSEGTLNTTVGIVTYSKAVMQRGYRITTQSGFILLCSDTAPICTDAGFVKVPDLLGKRIAVRVDGREIVTRFELVEVVAEVGTIQVQHISVNDQAFWAGAEHGRYVLHHNKIENEEGW